MLSRMESILTARYADTSLAKNTGYIIS
ncbi:hypothetical protein SBA5_1200001 [Candidatus Sulfotelmatomonas gaucii]|uniref:Uncharacterized protein n=1 Tax=Candidatus Sulfuritelmatomonas gaucii TaxID=2043161 RepID=A0A2N9L3V1_9BACT|nr:hypothetical protein SBA5_1200001 [Candidatus Sulfotelmatomonas gaucii]